MPNITKKANKKTKSVVYLIAAWEAGFKTAALKCTFISPAASSDLCFATLKMHTDQKKRNQRSHMHEEHRSKETGRETFWR